MIKKIVFLVVMFLPTLLWAQVTISVQLPQVGMVQKDQLWNLVLVNNSNATVEANVFLNLQDAVTGQTVLSAGSRSVILNKGVKLLNAQQVQPIQYNFSAAGFTGNYLPIGSYIACYTISKLLLETVEVIANECVRLNITPLSPPQLNTPADHSEIRTTSPQFTWIPPAPMAMFDNLNYDFSVVEVRQGQLPAEAIQYNTPVYAKANTKSPYENYPSTYSKLEQGKTYAWQVIAKNGLSYATSTDVWTFKISNDSTKTEESNVSYILLRKDNNASGVNYLRGNSLYIKYYSFDRDHESTIRFLTAKGKLLQEKRKLIAYGDNFLDFELNKLYHKGQIYFIEITDQQNQKYTASFSLQ
jgi:hypothetical protein